MVLNTFSRHLSGITRILIWRHLVSGDGETGDISEARLRDPGRWGTTPGTAGGDSGRTERSYSIQGQSLLNPCFRSQYPGIWSAIAGLWLLIKMVKGTDKCVNLCFNEIFFIYRLTVICLIWIFQGMSCLRCIRRAM